MNSIKFLSFCVLLAQMLTVQASLLTDLLAIYSTNTSVNSTAQISSNCPVCICQCTPIVFGSAASSPCSSAPVTQAPALPATTAAPTIPDTTTPATTTTTIAPKVDVCTTTYQVKTAANTNLKTLCYIAGRPLPTLNATAFCMSNGMKLYELTDADSVKGYQNFVNAYVPSSGPIFVANGIYLNGKWVLFSDQTTPLYSGLVYGASRAIAPEPTPAFLYGREANMSFIGYAYNFNKDAYFMCQY
ncbi:uncharacterized protein [Chironomus tepperi]|uniref:uncharacterized protein n=1 Tax=Chironomus tepperi TaxID=113505 RepID=UPI00391F2E78